MIYATLAYVGEETQQSTVVDAAFQVMPNRGDLIEYKGARMQLNGKVTEIKHIAKNAVEPANIWIGLEPV